MATKWHKMTQKSQEGIKTDDLIIKEANREQKKRKRIKDDHNSKQNHQKRGEMTIQ